MAEVIADVTTEVPVPEPLEPEPPVPVPPEPKKKPTVRPPVAVRPAVTVKKRAVVEQLSLPVAVVVQSTLAERLNQAFANQFEKGK